MLYPIYLDYMSTTPVDKRVLKEMIPYLGGIKSKNFGNASSKHYYGYRINTAIEIARAKVARLVNCDINNIVWTSGATEANNLAIKGISLFYAHQGKHIITSKIEHKSVLESCKYLENNGFEVTYLSPEKDGLIDINKLNNALKQDTILISIMHVNNEIGVIQNISEIGQIAHSKGILFHVDAAQSLGKIPINLQDLHIDLMTFSGHKIYGPKGIGALYIRKESNLHLLSQMNGGFQENGLRAGTLATHQIVGMGAACQIAMQEMEEDEKKILALSKKLWKIINDIGDIQINGSLSKRISGNINIIIKGINNEVLLSSLYDIAISKMSSCILNNESSHVLKAIGISDNLIENSIRISIGKFTTKHEIMFVGKRLKEVIFALRKT